MSDGTVHHGKLKPGLNQLPALLAVHVALGLKPPGERCCEDLPAADGDEQSTCVDEDSLAGDDGASSSCSADDKEPIVGGSGATSFGVGELALQLAVALAPLAEERASLGSVWAGFPIGLRQVDGYPALFQPQKAAENARLLDDVIQAACEAGAPGLGAALKRARCGLSHGGACRAALDCACTQIRAVAIAELQAAKQRRAEVLEEGRMQQCRGRTSLGCSRPSDIGLDTAAHRTCMLLGGEGVACDAVVEIQRQATDQLSSCVRALHDDVRALASLVEVLSGK